MVSRFLILTALLIFSLTAIAIENIDRSTLVAERATRSYQDMLDVRLIRALVVRNKTGYFFDGAEQRGITYDLLKTFEKELNEELGTGNLPIYVSFVPVNREELIPSLLEGRGDLAVSNITITPERRELIDFSMPVYTGVRELLVTGEQGESFFSVEQLSGQTVHVRKSSSYYASLMSANAELQEQGLTPIDVELVSEYLEDEDLLEMVNAQLIPAIVVDSHKADFWKQIFDRIRIHEGVVFRDGGQIAWAFRKDSAEFEQVINRFLQENRKGTLMGNILFKRYLQNTKHVRNALDPAEMEKFNAAVVLFQKYALQYKFDWLMLVAQAYQESRLDQNTRSAAGAVGVMQLLPSTAADKSVGIEDIHDLENNIHAGAKYMRWLRDNYFSDPGMNAEEQTLFTFAAYNAGPGKVSRMRTEAEEMGLDPNVWFDNVEVVAAKRIGRETVQYVSNIYKYWVAYNLALDIGEIEQPVGGP